MPRLLLVLLAAVFGVVVSATAGPKKIVTHSPDSLAPKTAPAHWLPPEAWVYNHWLPYDETRLYKVVGITRNKLWQQLRDDKRTLAQLAAKHGWKDPKKLAATLVAPRAASVDAATLARLQDRAERTITQGHLAQHVFFHSLHQFALPSAAPELFGVTDAQFRELRRAELSPLAIGRLHGRSPGEVQAQAIAVLRDRLRAGVAGDAMSREQAKILEQRQLSQLPRWLDQQRYNGPPRTANGALTSLPKDYASNPSIAADGRSVAYESYRQKLPLALKFGEIAVLRNSLASGKTTLVSTVSKPGPTGLQPASSYNPSISGSGSRVVYETSDGNQNFGKRYGRISVLLCDLSGSRSGEHTTPVDTSSAPPGESDSQSAYNPAVSADGRSVAFQAVSKGRTRILLQSPRGLRTVVAGAPAGSRKFSDPFEPGVSADGTRVVFTRTHGIAGVGRSGGSSVEVQDLKSGKRLGVSGAGGAGADGPASDPAISPDGRFVAFSSSAKNLPGGAGGPGIYLYDLAKRKTVRISSGAGLDPVVSRGGTTVAYTVVSGQESYIAVWHAKTGKVERASVVTGSSGAAADGRSDDPSISDDGTRIAFVSTATNLAPANKDGQKAIYVRDLKAGTTSLVSNTAKAYEVGS